jgi:condensin complex subunit 2
MAHPHGPHADELTITHDSVRKFQVPENVSVSFYFICALHLANEKGLELIGQDDLSDFAIASGTE